MNPFTRKFVGAADHPDPRLLKARVLQMDAPNPIKDRNSHLSFIFAFIRFRMSEEMVVDGFRGDRALVAMRDALRQLQTSGRRSIGWLKKRLYRDRAAESLLPETTGDINTDEMAPYVSWSKLNIFLSFTGGLALANVQSSVIRANWAACAVDAAGNFFAFVLATAVYSSGRILENSTVQKGLLGLSSVNILSSFAVILCVVQREGRDSA